MNQQYNSDPGTKRGLIILGTCLIILLGFFFWYNNRSARYSIATVGTEQPKGFFESILKPSEKETSTENQQTSDQDGDGLADEDEAGAGTDPLVADSDSDGLSDREELKVYTTNPLKADTDGDGFKDGAEIASRQDPKNSDPAALWPPRPANLSL